jgi:hypothetical protein
MLCAMIDFEKEILAKAQSYCDATGVGISTLGKTIVNDGKFFTDLAAGRNPTLKTLRRVDEWLSKNMPSIKKSKRK